MNVVALTPPALAKNLRPLVDALDEVSATYSVRRRLAMDAIKLAAWAITRNTGWTVYVEQSDEYGMKSGIWEAATEAIQHEVLTDLDCSDYVGGMDSRRDRAIGVRVRAKHYQAIINAVGAFSEQDGRQRTSNPTDAGYPSALQAAIDAFEAVHDDDDALRGKTAKQALFAWLVKHRPALSKNTRTVAAEVANWQRKGGAPKTPG